MKLLIYIILLLFFCGDLPAQTLSLDWAYNIGDTQAPFPEKVTDIVVDAKGNIYITGTANGTINYSLGGVDTSTSIGCGDGAIFVSKQDSVGNLIWTKVFNSPCSYGEEYTIAVDKEENVYLGGQGNGPLNSIGINYSAFVIKFDALGNIIWSQGFDGFPGPIPDISYLNDIVVDNKGYLYITGSFEETIHFGPIQLHAGTATLAYICKMDTSGTVIWAKQLGDGVISPDEGKAIALDTLGNVYITGRGEGDFDPSFGGVANLPNWSAFVCKLDSAGNFVWVSSIGNNSGSRTIGNGIVLDKKGNIYITGGFKYTGDFDPGPGVVNYTSAGDQDLFVVKLDTAGSFLWAKATGSTYDDLGTDITIDDLDNIYVTGKFANTVDFSYGSITNSPLTSTGYSDIFIQKLDEQGNVLMTRKIGVYSYDKFPKLCLDNSKKIYLAGNFRDSSNFDPNNNSPYINSFSEDGFVAKYSQKYIQGYLYQDFNQNCHHDSTELGVVANKNLIISPSNTIVSTDNMGYWCLNSLPVGTYTITVDTSDAWLTTCPNPQIITVTNSDSFIQVPAFGMVNKFPCTAPYTSIYAPFLRPGFSNQKIYVQACNEHIGTGIMDSVYIVVELDALLTVDSASITFIDLGNQRYQFFIADSLYPSECIDFWLSTTLSTSAILGQSLCMSTELYPLDSCVLDTVPNTGVGIPCSSPYDNSHLRILGNCINNDSVSFNIINVGSDMSCPTQVRLYIDGGLIWMDSIQLLSGQNIVFTFLGDGKTWRMEADQHPLHPGNSQPSATLELCGNMSNWTPNLVNILPHNDFDPVIDIYCGEVTGSYDPNDKTGFPLGVDSTHNILPNQKIEYLIRFQNTGLDTAFNIVIRDTLSTHFNLFSVKSGVSSHDYTFRKYGPRVLEWTFSNIMLPDSNVNEQLSHGFVKFEVQQNPDLPNGTLLENSAAIYFDFNVPIITNTSMHTIHRNVLSFVNIDRVALEKVLEIKVYPNPTSGLLHIERQNNEELRIMVIDQLGRVVHSQSLQDGREMIDLGPLPRGIYFLSISNDKKQFLLKIIKR